MELYKYILFRVFVVFVIKFSIVCKLLIENQNVKFMIILKKNNLNMESLMLQMIVLKKDNVTQLILHYLICQCTQELHT